MKSTEKIASMFMAGALALTMGFSAVATPCVALAQETQTQEQNSRYITADDALQVVLNHAYDECGLTPDRMYDLEVKDDSAVKGKLMNYYVTFNVENRGEQRQYYIYYVRATDGCIWGFGIGTND